MIRDSVEETVEYKQIEEKLEKELSEQMKKITGLGSCHIYWSKKKRILKEKYGIDWNSPSELNPHICFD